MEIDNSTLLDLGVFPREGETFSVFGMMNTCRTAKGTQLLDAFLRNPKREPEAIVRVQEALLTLRGLPDHQKWPFQKGKIEEAEKYLWSNILVIEPSPLGLDWANHLYFSLRYRRLAEILGGYAKNLFEVLTMAEGLPLGAFSSAPDPLGGIGKGIKAFFEVRLKNGRTVHDSLPQWKKASPLTLDGIFRIELGSELKRLMAHFHQLDLLISLGDFNSRHNLVNPQVLPEEGFRISASNLRHLSLLGGQGNDVHLGEARSVLFLTGPNMAGKSTLLKSIGLAAYLGQLGLGVPAESFAFSVLGGLLASIGISDSVALGNSYYMSEVNRVKDAALLSGQVRSCLLLFDETFKGTNVMDATDATLALVRSLACVPGIMAIVSSHLHGAAEELAAAPNVLPMKMEVKEGTIEFAYRLEAGVSTQRLGMRLLEEQGVLRLLASISERRAEIQPRIGGTSGGTLD